MTIHEAYAVIADRRVALTACCGNVDALPIVSWQGTWMTVSQFTEALTSAERVVLHTGPITHDEDDDVTKREFESAFQVDSKVAVTMDGRYARVSESNWISAITQGAGATPAELIEKIIVASWEEVEEEEESFVVGHSNDTEIYRSVTIFNRLKPEASEA